MLPGPPLRIAVLANFDSPHAWRWMKVFVERGHEVHAISYYRPRAALPGVTVHVLREAQVHNHAAGGGSGRTIASRLPPSALRLVNAFRFRRAGLDLLLQELQPDLLHAHYVVEHGFFAALAGFHPLVISAWGSDLFQAPRTHAGAFTAGYALRHADLVSGNDPALIREAVRLGAPAEKAALVRLGLEEGFLEEPVTSVNLTPSAGPPTILSDRALEPLYNVDVVIRAFHQLRNTMPSARLIVAHDGSQRGRLEELSRESGETAAIDFVGRVDTARLRELLSSSHVYVSVPSSDSLAASTMEAMACGAFPLVSDLPSQDGWIIHHVTGLRVPVRDVRALADSLHVALLDNDLRRAALAPNRAKVEAEGSLTKNMLVMERHYYRLAGRPVADESL